MNLKFFKNRIIQKWLPASALLISASASAAVIDQQGSFVVEGQLDSGGTPLTGNATFTLDIYDPSASSCLLYEESQTVSLSPTGAFSLQVGSTPGLPIGQTYRTNLDPGLAMSAIFNNSHLFTATSGGTPCTYNPTLGDSRLLKITVTTVNGTTTLSDVTIGAAPIATVAETLQGVSASGFVQTNAPSWTTLIGGTASDASSLHHHDSLYARLSSGTAQNLGSGGFYSSGTVGVGTIIQPSGTQFQVLSSGGATVAEAIQAGGGQSGDLLDFKNSVGTVVSSFNSAGVLNGNVVGNVTGNLTGNVTGNVTGAITGNVTGSASLNVLKAGDTMTGTLNLPTAGLVVGANQLVVAAGGSVGIGTTAPSGKLEIDGPSGATLKIVDTNQGSGKVLTSDLFGNASWQIPATAPVTSVAGRTGAVTLTHSDLTDWGTATSTFLTSASSFPAANLTGVIAPSSGGTGTSNTGTLTYGNNNLTFTTSGATTVTLPTSGTLATLASPALTGTPTSTTATTGTNSTQIATTAFVIGQAATTSPIMDGTAAVGTSTSFARQDHVHPTDTSRAPAVNPTFTGLTTFNGNVTSTGTITANGFSSGGGTIQIGGAGLPATPTLSFSGAYTDTGIFMPAAHQFGITTFGVQRMVVDANGNVGVGASSPVSLLNVSGTPVSSQALVTLGSSFTGSAGGTVLGVNGASGFAGNLIDLQTNNTSYFSVSGTGAATLANGTSTPTLSVTNSGLGSGVAISSTGTNNSTLNVTNTSGTVVPAIQITSNSGTGAYAGIFQNKSTGEAALFYVGTAAPSTIGLTAGAVATFATSTNSCSISPASGSVQCSSDVRLKKDIEPIEDALGQILQLRGVTYRWKSMPQDQDRHVGFIAQELEKIVPSLVATDSKGFKQVNYANLTPVLAEAIKSLYTKITALESQSADKDRKIAAQQMKIEELNARMDRLEKKIGSQ